MHEPQKPYGRVKLIMVNNNSADCRCLTNEDLERLPALKEALNTVQDSYLKIISRYPAHCYELFLQPSSVELSRDEAKVFSSLIGGFSEAPSRQGAVVVEWKGQRYRLWIDLEFCG